jgi:hypothetical protein
VGRRENKVSASAENKFNITANVLFFFSQLKRTTEALLASQLPGELPSPLKMTTTLARQIFQLLISEILKVI